MAEKKVLNPVTLLFLGACPAVAVSTGVKAALATAAAVALVLVGSALVLKPFAKLAGKPTVAVIVLVTAAWASAAEIIMSAMLPQVYAMLGIYAAAIAVNYAVFDTAELAAEKWLKGILNAMLVAVEFAAAVLVLGAVREVLGSGSIFGTELAFLSGKTAAIWTKASGGLMLYAIELAVVQKLAGARGRSCGTAAAAAGIAAEKEA